MDAKTRSERMQCVAAEAEARTEESSETNIKKVTAGAKILVRNVTEFTIKCVGYESQASRATKNGLLL